MEFIELAKLPIKWNPTNPPATSRQIQPINIKAYCLWLKFYKKMYQKWEEEEVEEEEEAEEEEEEEEEEKVA